MDADYKILSLWEGAELVLCTDGTYTLQHTDTTEKLSDIGTFFLIQCYSNGCINKVPIEDLIAMRFKYKYSHGFYPLATLLATSIVSIEDRIYVKYMKSGIEQSTSIDVQKIRSHSMLGLRGVEIIGTSFDKVTAWYLNGNLINDHPKKTKPINSNDGTASEDLESDAPNGFLNVSKVENQCDLEKVFSEYLKYGRNIPKGQKHAIETLTHCQTKEDFWHVINTLFKCDARVYRSPIIDYLNENDISQFMPNKGILSSVCEQLFSIEDKPEKNIEFLYHFKDILTDEIKEKMEKNCNILSQPNAYYKLCNMLGMDTNELIEYCIKQSNAASYYCVYETLLNVHEKEGYFAVNKLITFHINNLNDTSIQGKLIKRLIYSDFKKEKSKPYEEITKIKAGGFNEYIRLCKSYEGKQNAKTIQNTITSNVGKNIRGSYVASFSNHYFLIASNGIRILLPKNMVTKALHKGDSANVHIVYADKIYNTLYASQMTSFDYIKIIQMPLLNNGDIIEISFESNGKPVPHKCYKKISVSLVSYPKKIDNKVRYKAKVIRQTLDRYHYLVKIVE